MFEGPEKKFQRHIADYFIRKHRYGVLEQDEITDTEYYFAEGHLIAFLHIAADTSDVMVATDPGAEKNFSWYNTGLENKAKNKKEYPVQFLYCDVLAKETILEALSFFLIYVPQKEAERDKPEKPACTIFPRYHQSRMVHKVTQDALGHFTTQGNIGKKYLIAHSAGSGKTLSICWLADRFHSLYKPGAQR